jgi:hypothetical protein
VASRHAIWIAAPPARVYQAAREADLGRPWPVRLLMGIRVIPAWLAMALRGPRQTSCYTVEQRWVGAATFTLIAEAPGEEFVLGIMGRFWTPTGGLVPATADTFRLPPPAGLAQAMWNFCVSPRANGAELSTETRVRCGDEAARRQFERYWRIIRSGSSLIRGSMLRHIRSTAQQRAA